MPKPVHETGFNTDVYTQMQVGRFKDGIRGYSGGPTYIEFGGKPFGDFHAARVLPGYDPDCKASMLESLALLAKIVMVVNARDVLPEPSGRYPRGRIRGDSSLRYNDETIRIVEQARQLGMTINDVVLSVTPYALQDTDKLLVEQFREDLANRGIQLRMHYEVPGYPHPNVLNDAAAVFGRNDVIAEAGRHLVVFSPGGGSGKFGVILSELYYALMRGEAPNFMKFETFPVFGLPADHPLNLAFEAATADLENTVIDLASGETTYDKDVENFRLLQEVYRRFGATDHPVVRMHNPTDMGVNVIEQGIVDMNRVVRACGREIVRRYERYVAEHAAGDEKPSTVERAGNIKQQYTAAYPDFL